jgi:isopenicillin N synthase-like dioxygenase
MTALSLLDRPGLADLPVIDIAPLRRGDASGRTTVAQAMRRACIDTGFFYIAEHGFDEHLTARLFGEIRRFFDQPEAEKERVSMYRVPIKRGYDGIGNQTLDAATGPDRKESMFVGIDLPLDHPMVRAGTPNHGPNQWPAGLLGWRQTVETYFAEMERLSRVLLNGLALSLDLPWGYFDFCLDDQMSTMRMLHYPPHPTADPEREVGCGAHTDWGALTVLAQDDTGGLELQMRSGAWMPARPVPGTFIVNIGDMMARWTNDLYTSTPHRVLNRSPRDRYSAAFFFDPSYHTRVECLDTCRSDDRPALYPPITSGEHLMAMYRKTYPQAQ